MAHLPKRQSHAFSKDIYLLGIDSNGERVWLEAPSWDCGWYWGFGYVERYTNNSDPSKAKDITCHTHIDSEFAKGKIKDEDGFDTTVINVNEGLELTTYTVAEGERLNALFTKFYRLRVRAEKEKDKADHINKKLIPAITKEIIEILSVKNLDKSN